MTFKSGTSGNPIGRPRGARDKATALFERIMAEEGRGALRTICRQAGAGNVEMATLFAIHVLPKLVPAPRARRVQFHLSNPSSATAILADTARAVADGHLTPAEAEQIGTLARARMEAVDLAEMRAALRRLEARNAGIGSDLAADHPSGNGQDGRLA
jgi:hypothetical protein